MMYLKILKQFLIFLVKNRRIRIPNDYEYELIHDPFPAFPGTYIRYRFQCGMLEKIVEWLSYSGIVGSVHQIADPKESEPKNVHWCGKEKKKNCRKSRLGALDLLLRL